MEYRKKIKLLSGIVVILLASYITGTFFSHANVYQRRATQPVFDRALINKISAMKVDLREGYIFLQRENNNWFFIYDGNKFPASADRVEAFIDSVSRITKHQLVSSNPRNWDRFDLVDGKSRDAFFFDSTGNKLFSLHIGKSGPSSRVGEGEYVRTSLSDEVFLISAPIIRHFQRDANFWGNLRVFPEDVNSNTISAVRIRVDEKFADVISVLDFSMRRESVNNIIDWREASGNVVNRNSANMLLNNIATLVGDRFSQDHIIDRNGEIELETDGHGRIILDIKLLEDYSVLFGIRGGDYRYGSALFRVERILDSVERIVEELR
ncbi:MAG: DUF4340 domain-containing protein [Spirochaetes bacterium]|nr:DUF4340 domain-containing protein [Spirochaetota bacterium]